VARVLDKLRALVAMNESLKSQESQFKAHCREERARLEANIARLQTAAGEEGSEEQERVAVIQKHYDSDKERLQKIRALLARRNREIAQLQRKIDEVPSRTEMAQYQRRFIELYNQVASTLTETKQFYTLYNTLEDQKEFMEKEVEILNNIHEKFELGMSTEKNKELFLRQVQEILNGVKQDREGLEARRAEEKAEKDRLNGIYLELVEKQRTYYKTVRDFQEECRKNEILVAKLKAKRSR
jgi:chromosome segregation ATPase